MRSFAAALAIAGLAAVPAAAAATPAPASGTVDFQVLTSTQTGQADGNAFFAQHNAGTLAGTFSGTFETRTSIVRHADGSYELVGTRTCACTVDGRTGTVVFRIVGSGVFGVSFEGRLVVLDAEGALEGLHSVQTFAGTFVGPGHGIGTYAGTYHFAPPSPS